MLLQSALVIALASFGVAAPAKTYYGIGLEINVSPAGQPAVLEPAPVQINKLTSLHGTHASQITLDKSTAVNVDINSIECRAYKDAAGVEPGSAPFTYANPAELSTNLVEVESVLCYITETS